MSLCIDIETIPQAREILESKLPDEIKNAVMPPEIANPEEPNWEEKCPAYGLPELKQKLDKLKVEAEDFRKTAGVSGPADADEKARLKLEKAQADWNRKMQAIDAKVEGASKAIQEARQKRAAWLEENFSKYKAKCQADRQKWELGIMEAKSKFFRDAALDARLAHVKLLGIKNTHAGWTRIFIWETDKAIIAPVRAWFKGLPVSKDVLENSRKFRDTSLILSEYLKEADALKAFFAVFAQEMGDEVRPDCVTYFGNQWDFPFLYRRAWITGLPQRPLYKRGRYWDDRMIDLHEVWQFGDRQASVGGLDGLSATLGANGAKTQDGANFFEWYLKDPVEGVVYLINDISLTEHCARTMGVIK